MLPPTLTIPLPPPLLPPPPLAALLRFRLELRSLRTFCHASWQPRDRFRSSLCWSSSRACSAARSRSAALARTRCRAAPMSAGVGAQALAADSPSSLPPLPLLLPLLLLLLMLLPLLEDAVLEPSPQLLPSLAASPAAAAIALEVEDGDDDGFNDDSEGDVCCCARCCPCWISVAAASAASAAPPAAAAAEDDVEDKANVEFDHGTNGVEVDPDPATAAADAPPRDGFQLLLCLTVESGNGYTCCACGEERRVDLPPPLLPLPGGPNVAGEPPW